VWREWEVVVNECGVEDYSSMMVHFSEDSGTKPQTLWIAKSRTTTQQFLEAKRDDDNDDRDKKCELFSVVFGTTYTFGRLT